MRKDFSKLLLNYMQNDNCIYFLTADLGYGLWDEIRSSFPNRAYNVMSSEQLMVGTAVGIALEGHIPICYSITPFLLYRPFEFIRNYLNHEQIPVKLVGGGRNKDYGYLGYTHWAEDDQSIMNNFNNIKQYRPNTPIELKEILHSFLYKLEPAYLNLIK